jgi:DNA primase
MIPRDFLDDLLSRTDIVSVIGSHLDLKKKGANFLALCPFHSEKSPSFTVNASKQFYHCFGCGASGDALKFLMDYCGMSFPQVLSDLAKQQGMTLPNEGKVESTDFKKKNLHKNNLKNLLITAARFYQKKLKTKSKGH